MKTMCDFGSTFPENKFVRSLVTRNQKSTPTVGWGITEIDLFIVRCELVVISF